MGIVTFDLPVQYRRTYSATNTPVMARTRYETVKGDQAADWIIMKQRRNELHSIEDCCLMGCCVM
jgi:hypothetical protein